MKKIVLFTFLIPSFSFAQTQIPTVIEPGTPPAAALKVVQDGYTAPNGWTIKPGDDIRLGKGTMPNKAFAFAYQSPVGWASESSMDATRKRYMLSNMVGKVAKVKGLTVSGRKKTGYIVIAKVGVGEIVNYWIEIDNAIEAGEIIAPAEFAKKETENTSPALSVADELKKLKELLDSGAITQEEYNTQKKKLLNQIVKCSSL